MRVAGHADAYDRHTGSYGRELSAWVCAVRRVEPRMRVLDVDPVPELSRDPRGGHRGRSAADRAREDLAALLVLHHGVAVSH